MLFFNPYSDKPFPFFSQSAKYYHHPSAQARIPQGLCPKVSFRGKLLVKLEVLGFPRI